MRIGMIGKGIYSWKEVMGWPRYKRRILKRMIDRRYIFPIVKGCLGGGRMVRRMVRVIGIGILFGKWTCKEWEITLNPERDYIEVRWKGED